MISTYATCTKCAKLLYKVTADMPAAANKNIRNFRQSLGYKPLNHNLAAKAELCAECDATHELIVSPKDFLGLAKDAVLSQEQYYNLIKEHNPDD